jgi:hypothetical protein
VHLRPPAVPGVRDRRAALTAASSHGHGYRTRPKPGSRLEREELAGEAIATWPGMTAAEVSTAI